jgi:glutathione S-transferase
MRLIQAPGSPFVRKVRVLIREIGVADQVEEVETTIRQPDSEILKFNPLGKIPTLETDDGICLTESLLISDYLEALPEAQPLTPATGPARWRALALDAFASALMDCILWRMREVHRREEAARSPNFIEFERGRAHRGYDALEARLDEIEGPVNRAQITLACAFAFADHWLPDDGWRDGRPNLVAWYDVFKERPSMVATLPEAWQTPPR